LLLLLLFCKNRMKTVNGQPQIPPAEKDLPAPIPPVTPAPAFTKVDNNLTSVGFFTASSKRSRRESEKNITTTDKGVERRISILAGGKLGQPITQDQDYWLALMKLVSEHVQRTGKLENPFSFTTAELTKTLGQTHCGKNYKAVLEWADVMTYTGVKNGAYDIAKKRWLIDRTHVLERFVSVGKELPDGTIADKNHVWFSEWQLDNINSGNLMPIELSTYTRLNTNIARTLVPHLQEWLFASQRDGRFEKNYEDVCQLLGIRTYDYRSKIQEKLGPPLDELVMHGYISQWSIMETANGKSYKLVLWHGDKYRNDRQSRLKGKLLVDQPGGDQSPAIRRPRQQRLQLAAPAETAPEQPEAATAGAVNQALIAELARRGIGQADARQLLAHLIPGQPVLDQLEWGDYQISRKRGHVENPPGFYISLLRRNVPVPANFLSSQKARELQASERARQEALQEQRQEAERAEREERARVDARIDAMPEAHRLALFEQAKAQLLANHPGMAMFFRTNPENAIHDGAVRGRMHQILAQGWTPPETH
jgi:hypothetical protein